MTGFGLNQNLRRTLRIIAVVVGLMACVVPQIALGQVPFHASSGAVSGGIVEKGGRGFGAQFTAGHIAGQAVGREESVSHIGLQPFINIGDSVGFLDSRLARANRGGLAWSFGGGLRHYFADTDTIFGVNGYFDRDQITGGHFKQWGVGAELLGPVWDLRGNYYSPIGENEELLGTQAQAGSVQFVGNGLEFNQVQTISRAFEGFDAEAGVKLPGAFADRFDMRAYGGGYWFDGEAGDDVAGWKTRLEARPWDLLELGLQVSHDSLFKTNVNFNVAIHFGGYRRGTSDTKRSNFDRITRRVRRSQTMITALRNEVDENLTAINPNTGTPFEIAHVNSSSPGPFVGTVENPFLDIAQAQAVAPDVIFVHSGSQYNAGPDNTVVVAENQQILGEGFIPGLLSDRTVLHTLTVDGVGEIALPASPDFIASGLTGSRPILANSIGAAAVTLQDNSEFSGFIIQDAANIGLRAIGTTNGVARENDILNAGAQGILLQDTEGVFGLVNNTIEGSAGAALHVDGGFSQIRFAATSDNEDPASGRIVNSSGPAVLVENTVGGFLNMSGTTLDDDGGEGIIVRDAGGDVTFDNVSILNSTANGILIDNSSGTFTFRNTIRNSTLIDNAALEAIVIRDLQPGGSVNFGDLQIDNRNSTALLLDGLAASIRFNEDVVINAQPAGAVAALTPALAFTNAAPTGSVTFGQDLTIGASSGQGILISGNQVDPPAPDPDAETVPAVISRSAFTVEGQTIIDSPNLEGILIQNDDADVEFNGVTVSNRQGEGIEVDNSRGFVDFNGQTNIDNQLNIAETAMVIQNSPALINVESLTITNGINAAGLASGLLISNNIANAQGSAAITFETVNINTTTGTAILAQDNSRLTIEDGIVNAAAGDAIDIDNSTLFNDPDVDPDSFSSRITLQSVDSVGGVNGIRLVNLGRTSRFTVTGDPNLLDPAATGGTISGATNAGAFLQNAGRVSLRGMLFDDNENGIVVFNDRLDLDNDEIADDNLLQLLFTRVTASNAFGLLADDLLVLNIEDSMFDLNGDDATDGRESIFLRYNTLLNDDDTTEFQEFDNPFIARIVRTMIVDETDDSVVIMNTASANGAHLSLDFQDNILQNSDTSDPDATDTEDHGLEISWNGPFRGTVINNAFSLTGGNQDAINLESLSTTDLFEFEMNSNNITSTLGNDQGLVVRTVGQSIFDIQNNVVDLTGGDGEGFVFSLAALSNVNLANNAFVERTDGGAGIVFNTLAAPANIRIEGNGITLFDSLAGTEEGIVFRSVAGVVNLSGDISNTIQLGPTGGFIETIFFMTPGTNNGQIIVNGVNVP